MRALGMPDADAAQVAIGLTSKGSSPDKLGTATREQFARYARLIKAAGISAD